MFPYLHSVSGAITAPFKTTTQYASNMSTSNLSTSTYYISTTTCATQLLRNEIPTPHHFLTGTLQPHASLKKTRDQKLLLDSRPRYPSAGFIIICISIPNRQAAAKQPISR